MRILYCNKYNYRFSGTEAYLFDLIHGMDERGHETALFSMDHGHAPSFAGRSYYIPHVEFKDRSAGFLKKVRMAAHAIYSPSARHAMRGCVTDFSLTWLISAESITICRPRFFGNSSVSGFPWSTTSTILRSCAQPTILLPMAAPALSTARTARSTTP